MELLKIEIKNFRSVQHLTIPIPNVNNSKTYALLGINESGKSSILHAINLFDNEEISYPTDYFENDKDVQIIFHYEINKGEKDFLFDKIKEEEFIIPNKIKTSIKFNQVVIAATYSSTAGERTTNETINFTNPIFEEYTLKDKNLILKESDEDLSFNFQDFLTEHFPNHFWKHSHKIILWKSSPEYLILEDIDLLEFSDRPSSVSIPLQNCFRLIGHEEQAQIKAQISKLNTPIQINNLQSELSDKVSDYINEVWPEHAIRIKFQINNNKITLLIEDNGVKYNAKTTNQRSDGFRQFISFLLTTSIENHTGELSNTILLVDEPETHLHPPAQINLLQELIKITANQNDNIVFFATHSNYMIDKQNMDRCFKILKKDNHITQIDRIAKKGATYSEVNYEVFNILTNDYHNELYGYLEDVEKTKLTALKKDKIWINEKTNKNENVSLATYIRHSIHHPENKSNKKFTEADLRKSIEILRKIKY